MQNVHEVYITDVTGKHTVRFTPASMLVEAFQGGVLWTASECMEVLNLVYRTRLASIGIEHGAKFGCVSDSTTFGLFDGRKPRWMRPEQWQASIRESEAIAAR